MVRSNCNTTFKYFILISYCIIFNVLRWVLIRENPQQTPPRRILTIHLWFIIIIVVIITLLLLQSIVLYFSFGYYFWCTSDVYNIKNTYLRFNGFCRMCMFFLYMGVPIFNELKNKDIQSKISQNCKYFQFLLNNTFFQTDFDPIELVKAVNWIFHVDLCF